MRKLLTILILSLFFLQGMAISQGPQGPPLKVLFIGNSYTSVNDLPSI
jgi:hypothetical protein